MFGWIGKWIRRGLQDIDNTIVSFVHILVNGVYGYFHLLHSWIQLAWKGFAAEWRFFERVWHDVVWGIWVHIATIVRHDLPLLWRFILHMWYYFQHLDKFAELLGDHLVLWLEKNAWRIAEKLGKFLLALVWHNKYRFLHLLEIIVSAIL